MSKQQVTRINSNTACPELPRLRGRLVVPADGCAYPPSVQADDLLRVNFDAQSVGPDGLYLVERIGPQGVEWRGCKRFARQITKGLMVDESGHGEWRPADLRSLDVRVVGYVEQVYRPTWGLS